MTRQTLYVYKSAEKTWHSYFTSYVYIDDPFRM